MNIEESSGIRSRLAALMNHSDDLHLLLLGEFGGASPQRGPPGVRSPNRASALPQHRPLKLSESPDHLHHHSPRYGGRVNGLGQAAETDLGFTEPLHDGEHVASRSGEPVEFPDDQDVVGPELIEQPLEFGAVPPAAGRFLTEDLLATSRFERGGLGSGVLFCGGDSCIPGRYW